MMSPKNRKALQELYEVVKWDLLILTIIIIIVFFISNTLRFNDIKDVVGTLQNISAAIFTIVGLWVGFLYPTAIQGIVNDDIDYIKNTKDVPRIEKLIYVIVISALVMLGTLIFYIFKSAFSNTIFYADYKGVIKVLAFSFVYFSCWLQARCIVSVIISNIRFANNLHSKISGSRINHDN
ncbi:hypothetical protein [Pectobacterium brasiliense]|uniref:hypothetical protein n=1 Tax=Pectobacterium brasiliense TaxID=180957 RepID=UPI001CF45E48|nr:hypothetical protein [Pectobacterium brasiliense]